MFLKLALKLSNIFLPLLSAMFLFTMCLDAGVDDAMTFITLNHELPLVRDKKLHTTCCTE